MSQTTRSTKSPSATPSPSDSAQPGDLLAPAPPCSIFRSFWLAGFESACHINSSGTRLDMLSFTQHDAQVEADYQLLRQRQIFSARDGLRWHLIETRPHYYNWSTVLPMAQAALRQNIQVSWNICHYGWPDDLDVFSAAFVDRFARYCKAVARFFAGLSDQPPIYTPFNEISYTAWAIGTGGYMFPYTKGRDTELKRQFVRAAVAGAEAILDVDRRARFLISDPLIHVVPPRDRPDLIEAAGIQRGAQFDAWDMLSGRLEPELGGDPKYLDLMGVNFYHSNEWEHPNVRLRWEDVPRDDRWVPFHLLLEELYRRYERPLVVAETSHFGVGRARWLREMADETVKARKRGVPLEGVCLYPILDRPDWEDQTHWHNSGLFDLTPDSDGVLCRTANPEYEREFLKAQRLLHAHGCT